MAVIGLLGIKFRPRFARFHHQQLYAIDEVRTYREQNYKIIPDAKVNLAAKIIKDLIGRAHGAESNA
ncbi:hypothetical protein [Dyadobacter sp. CY261]|uniref:hypothetical protein n=1 Tax=Dyadobacter sp. CY261 TaxID=2907203 RepID=UPI0038D35C96